MDRYQKLADALAKARTSERCFAASRDQALEFIDLVLRNLFPHFAHQRPCDAASVANEIRQIETLLTEIVNFFGAPSKITAASLAEEFLEILPALHDALRKDAEALLRGDPAASSLDEVIVSYPGFLATAIYRVANFFYRSEVPIFPRLLTEHAHRLTGVDIHPGATIGDSFVIDHGTGIVIGETSIIGSSVKMYQGVTLGALSVEKGLAKKRRHPTIEDNVVIYSNATILGGGTVIGKNSVVGGNVWLTDSVPANSIVYQTADVKVRSQAPDWSI